MDAQLAIDSPPRTLCRSAAENGRSASQAWASLAQRHRRVALSPAGGLSPEALHPSLWRGHQLGRLDHRLPSTGYAALDAELPGGGWPFRALTELLLPHAGVGEIRLLAPSLAAAQRSERLVMLFDPPADLSAWALTELGIDVEQLLLIDTRAGVPPEPRRPTEATVDARLWALEQALKSGHVGAVLAWLPPRLRPERLRRLQLAAHNHEGPAFMLRDLAAAERPSAAPLRLALHPAGADRLGISVLKRRGPPLEAPLHLNLPAVLSHTAQQRARRGPAVARGPEPVLRPATFVNLA